MRCCRAVVLVLGVVAMLAAAPAVQAASGSPSCRERSVRVSVPGASRLTVAGSLCWSGARPPATVQLLLPGATYNRAYWDFPYRPGEYSYVRAAVAAGYATFAIDRLGTGRSSRPPGATLGNEPEAQATHQVIAALRSGAAGGRAFRRVVVAGHSYGSLVAWYEAAAYGDVDAVIVTGALHATNPDGNAALVASLYPAALDPRFAPLGLDETYLTTQPGTRTGLFHAPGGDPRIGAVDEATKDTVTTSEAAGVPVALASGTSGRIDVPVLLAVGSADRLFCGGGAADCRSAATVLAAERSHYAAAPCLDAFVLPGAGHGINLDRGAPAWFRAATRWTDRVLGPRGAPARC